MIAAASFGLIAYLTGNAVFAEYLQIHFVPGTGELAVVLGAVIRGVTREGRRLRELDIVQAFHSAQPRHGGTGDARVLVVEEGARLVGHLGRSPTLEHPQGHHHLLGSDLALSGGHHQRVVLLPAADPL